MSRWLLPLLVLPLLAGSASAAPRDRDRDKLPDRWERRHDLSTRKKSGKGDPDRDGLRNRREYRLRTNPRKKDTDGDGLRDRAEVRRYKTNPRKRDTDGDGFSDRVEILAGTDPRRAASRPPAPGSAAGPGTPAAPAPAPVHCDLDATPATLASQVSAATSGAVICLATGDYGTWSGTSKRITIRNAAGAMPTMRFAFGAGDADFVVSGVSGAGGRIDDGATNITIRSSGFTGTLDIAGPSTDGIVLDGNTHNWNVGPSSGGVNAKISLQSSLSGTLASPSVTIKNTVIQNGDLDGIHFGGGSGYQILGNRLANLCDMGANHTDNMQFDSSTTTNVRIAGNHVSAAAGCSTQGITSYDAGTEGVIIEDNVVDIRRPWGIELYGDRNSVVRHNTVRWHPDSDCMFSGLECGQIDINRKSSDPAGFGTQVYDNLARSVNFVGGSTGTAHHNTNPAIVSYVGPLDTWAGFALAPGSPGKGAASDGLDTGIRVP